MESGSRAIRPLRQRDVQLYRVCDDLTEPVIYFMVLFSPWAFGTTQPWAIWTMNAAGYFLGVLLAVRLAVRWFKGYRPPRWGDQATGPQDHRAAAGSRRLVVSWSRGPVVFLSSSLAVLTIAILVFCLISALNARATFIPSQRTFDYHDCVFWLPHSLDSTRTWFAFWSYLALACSFWAVRDWLLGKTLSEQRVERSNPNVGQASRLPNDPESLRGSSSPPAPLLPARLRRLLWVLAINGALLGLEGIAQRLEGSGKLLFLVKPRVNPAAITQFGPYHYRSNAAQYFNLLWPVCLGFWWTIQRGEGRGQRGLGRRQASEGQRFTPRPRSSAGFEDDDENEDDSEKRSSHAHPGRKAHHLLLLCAVIIAACPLISTSRGGAMVTVGILGLAALLLPATHFLLNQSQEARRKGGSALTLLAVCFVAALALGYSLGWESLKPRLSSISEGFEGREQMYAAARPMAAQYPLFGTGPGTFNSVFELYRISTDTYWPAQLHNDWLETRITFGWIGSLLIALAFVTVLLRWFVAGGGIHGGRRFVILVWLSLGGCLVHARYDFPFQIYSIVFLFVLLCAMLFNLSRRA